MLAITIIMCINSRVTENLFTVKMCSSAPLYVTTCFSTALFKNEKIADLVKYKMWCHKVQYK